MFIATFIDLCITDSESVALLEVWRANDENRDVSFSSAKQAVFSFPFIIVHMWTKACGRPVPVTVQQSEKVVSHIRH